MKIAVELSYAGHGIKSTEIRMKRINKGEIPTEVRVSVYEDGVLDCEGGDVSWHVHLKLIDDRWQVVPW